MADRKVRDLLSRLEQLRASRGTWEDHWQDLADYLLPAKATFTNRAQAPGEKRTELVFDSSPMMAARSLAATLDGMLKPRTSRWFSVRPTDEDLQDNDEAKRWCETAEEILWRHLYAARARFAESTAEADLDIVVLGTGVVHIGAREPLGLSFRALHLRDTYIAENEAGLVDTLHYVQELTPRQAVQRYGRDNVSRTCRDLADDPLNADKEKLQFLQSVYPNQERDERRRDARGKPFTSCVVDVKGEHLVEERGFDEFPFAIGKWDHGTGEIYGRSPGMIALADVKTLNAAAKTMLEASQLAVMPPLMLPSDGLLGVPQYFPAGLNYYDSTVLDRLNRAPIEPLQTGTNLPIGADMLMQLREQIRGAFYLSLLQMPTMGPAMTATEVQARLDEMVRVIGPTFGRIESGYLAPMVERSFAILLRQGAFPAPPEILQGAEIEFGYRSPIQMARKRMETISAVEAAQVMQPYAAAHPEILDVFDYDEMGREVAEGAGVPTRWLLPPDKVDELRQQRAQAMQAQQQAAGISQVAEAAGRAAPALKLLEGAA